MNDNNYVLLNKDVPVLNFSFTENPSIHTPLISSINDIYDEHFAPLQIIARTGHIGLFDINYWWLQRGIGCFLRSRCVDVLNDNINFEQYYEIFKTSAGRGLNDHYWIKQESDSRTYSEINFFTNPFPEDFGNLFFTDDNVLLNTDQMLSPDLALAGHSFKTWKINAEGERLLYRIPATNRAICNDIAAAKIFEIFGIPHIDYWHDNISGKAVSVCKNFVTENTEYISLRSLANGIRYFDTGYLQKLFGKEKYSKFVQDVYKIALLAYVINNGDIDIGFLRNADTLEIIGIAPIFDFTDGFWYDIENEGVLHNSILQEIADDLPFYLAQTGFSTDSFEQIIPAVKEVFSSYPYFAKGEMENLIKKIKIHIDSVKEAAVYPVDKSIHKSWPLGKMWTLWMNNRWFESNAQ